jgi:hypothetical protein
VVARSARREAVLCCGEIDCRESLHRAVAAGKYTDLDMAIATTAQVRVLLGVFAAN